MSEKRKKIEPFEYKEYFAMTTALMVTMSESGKPNVMALDWKKLFEFEGKPVIRAQVAYSRHTYTLLTEGVKDFTINIPYTSECKKNGVKNEYSDIDISHAISIAGTDSGRNTDKFQKANLKVIPGKEVKVPTLDECVLCYECKTIHDEKSNMSSHHYFFGEIVAAYISLGIA